MMHGLAGRLGTTAVLDVDDVKVILISYRWQTLDPEMIRFVGLDPLREKILVVKSTIHYRAAFEPMREGDHRGGRARALLVQPRALSLPSDPAADLPLDPETTYP